MRFKRIGKGRYSVLFYYKNYDKPHWGEDISTNNGEGACYEAKLSSRNNERTCVYDNKTKEVIVRYQDMFRHDKYWRPIYD
jgi:hypothetical protein